MPSNIQNVSIKNQLYNYIHIHIIIFFLLPIWHIYIYDHLMPLQPSQVPIRSSLRWSRLLWTGWFSKCRRRSANRRSIVGRSVVHDGWWLLEHEWIMTFHSVGINGLQWFNGFEWILMDFSIQLECHQPNWLSLIFFQRGRSTTNQLKDGWSQIVNIVVSYRSYR